MPSLGQELVALYSLGDTGDFTAIRTVTGNTTLIAADRLLIVNSSSPVTVTIPAAATVSYAVGTQERIVNRGSAAVAIVDAATSATFTTLSTNQVLTLQNIGPDYWVSV